MEQMGLTEQAKLIRSQQAWAWAWAKAACCDSHIVSLVSSAILVKVQGVSAVVGLTQNMAIGGWSLCRRCYKRLENGLCLRGGQCSVVLCKQNVVFMICQTR